MTNQKPYGDQTFEPVYFSKLCYILTQLSKAGLVLIVPDMVVATPIKRAVYNTIRYELIVNTSSKKLLHHTVTATSFGGISKTFDSPFVGAGDGFHPSLAMQEFPSFQTHLCFYQIITFFIEINRLNLFIQIIVKNIFIRLKWTLSVHCVPNGTKPQN